MTGAVAEFTAPVRPKGKLAAVAARRSMSEPVCEDPKAELRRLNKLYSNWTKTSVALHHMRSDRKVRKEGASKGETIPCLLPDFFREDLARAQERLDAAADALVPEMARALRQLPIWQWLKTVAGVAERTAAPLVAETDIAIATKASSLKMFFGTCPSASTGRLVRRTAGQKNTYNASIRPKLFTMFESLVKNGAKTASEYPHGRTSKYLDVFHAALFGSLHDPRYDAAAKTWTRVRPDGSREVVRGGGAYLRKRAMWKAVDIFVEDLYVVWRALEGLPVWPDWYAVKLGYMHGGKIAVREPRMMSYEEALALVGDVGWRPLSEPRSWKLFAGDTEEIEGDDEDIAAE